MSPTLEKSNVFCMNVYMLSINVECSLGFTSFRIFFCVLLHQFSSCWSWPWNATGRARGWPRTRRTWGTTSSSTMTRAEGSRTLRRTTWAPWGTSTTSLRPRAVTLARTFAHCHSGYRRAERLVAQREPRRWRRRRLRQRQTSPYSKATSGRRWSRPTPTCRCRRTTPSRRTPSRAPAPQPCRSAPSTRCPPPRSRISPTSATGDRVSGNWRATTLRETQRRKDPSTAPPLERHLNNPLLVLLPPFFSFSASSSHPLALYWDHQSQHCVLLKPEHSFFISLKESSRRQSLNSRFFTSDLFVSEISDVDMKALSTIGERGTKGRRPRLNTSEGTTSSLSLTVNENPYFKLWDCFQNSEKKKEKKNMSRQNCLRNKYLFKGENIYVFICLYVFIYLFYTIITIMKSWSAEENPGGDEEDDRQHGRGLHTMLLQTRRRGHMKTTFWKIFVFIFYGPLL